MKKFQTLSGGIKLLIYVASGVAIFCLLILTLRLAYRGRVYPGVTANGTYLGGLTITDAQNTLNQQTSVYSQKPQSVMLPGITTSISANDLGATYNNTLATNEAFAVGRSGNIFQRASEQLTALFGMYQPVTEVSFNPTLLSNFLDSQNEQFSNPVINATIGFTNNIPTISESQKGNRINLPLSVLTLQKYFGQQTIKPINLSTLSVSPTISSAQLQMYTPLWTRMLTSPITLTNGAQAYTIDPKTAATWLAASPTDLPVKKDILNGFYNLPTAQSNTYFDSAKIQSWVKELAGQINIEPQDAALTIVDGKATVFTQSHDGKTLNEAATITSIQKLLALDSTTNTLPLDIAVTKAAVSNDNLDSLGIKELISEGVTYFPGSPSNRLQNVRVGAKQFNGVLLKPGEVFSFGQILGDVGPAQGYAPGLIILGDHEEKAYGGGLCQVSSTAYRAALLAGLPILQRTNHAFAISYYTAPFGVPGVDATIFYPQVDMKFLNDTGHYILIQTQMSGTTLKFDFYGTKTKSGVIRGPQYVSGNADPTIPSHTVFYRDVLDLSGAVIKTDTVNTYYKSSLDFPIE
jgi:vancomycin resistance protein YoaR